MITMKSNNRLFPTLVLIGGSLFGFTFKNVLSIDPTTTCEELRLATTEGGGESLDASMMLRAEECKLNAVGDKEQRSNSTKSDFFEQFRRGESECGVYLAPSTIPGAGLGMYAGKRYRAGEEVTGGDIIIPLPELDWHNNFELPFFLWEEYTWSAQTFAGMEQEIDFNTNQGCSTGIGAAINCMLPLVNIEDGYSSMDSGGLHRSKNPGSGAISIFHDRKSYAYRNIMAGEELFIDYGENYFESREEIYGLLPLHRHYEEADELLANYNEMLTYVLPFFTRKRDKQVMNEFKADLFDIIKNFPFESRTINALPEDHLQIPHILRIGTAHQHHMRSIRDVNWLEEHGKCMDNIKPGKSTIQEAGRGAFATRTIKKGSLVTPAPLIHIKDKEELRMYDALPETEDGYLGRNSSSPNHWQLLLNYVYGHPESNILLSPYGMFNGLINHHSERANTKIVWSAEMRHPEWMEQDPDLWTQKHVSGLSWDFVATRDIHPEEEIFIDYGQPWEEAWNQHEQTWAPPKNSENYITSYELESNIDLDLRTEAEGGYGPLLHVYCRSFFFPYFGLEEKDSDFYHCRILHRYTNPKNDQEQLYVAVLTRRMDNQRWRKSYERYSNILFGLPRDAFHFVDEPYTRDHLQTWSFRHEMMIPDELFPEVWKNKDKE